MPVIPITHIETKLDSDVPCIAGTRFTVPILIATLRNHPEWTIAAAAQALDLTEGQIYAALSYYFDHKRDIEAMWQAGDDLARSMGVSATELKQRIEQRRLEL